MEHPFQAFIVTAAAFFLLSLYAVASGTVPPPTALTVFLIAFAFIMIAIELQVSYRLAGNRFNVREAATGNSLALFGVVAALAMIQTLTDQVKFCGPALAVYRPPISSETVRLFGFITVGLSALAFLASFALAKKTVHPPFGQERKLSAGDYFCWLLLCISLMFYMTMIYSEGVSC